MEFDEVIEARKSTRSFKNKKASWKDVLTALDSSLKAPFSGNVNTIKFLIIENDKTIDKIADLAQQTWINEASILVVVCSDDVQLENLYGERGKMYGRQQSGAAIENILLKLTDLGLDSCWVGAYSDERLKQLLKIPAHIHVEAILPVGYEQKKPGQERKRKTSLDNTLRWEDWNTSQRQNAFEEAKLHSRPGH